MTADLIDSPTMQIPRDRWGRPLVVPPGGGKPTPYTRCTSFVDCLDDKYNLQRWQQRMVALGLAERPDLLLAVAAADRDDKESLDRITEQAQEAAKAHAAATTGTALHALTERHDRGLAIGPLPAAYRPDLDAYIRATACLKHVLIEQFAVHDELKIGGTPDRVVTYQGRGYIADVKTGSVEWGYAAMAMQLAVYSRSTPYHHRTGTRGPCPVDVDQDRGIIIHLPAGEGVCTLYWIDLATGWNGVQLASSVRKWRRRRNMLTPCEVSTPGDNPVDTVDGDDSITTAIAAATVNSTLADALLAITSAPTLDKLRATYTQIVESGVDSTAILPTCLARKAELGGS
jgi:hypothetical protein